MVYGFNPIEYQKAIDKLKQAKGDTVIRLIVAANLVKGVLC